MKRTLKTSILLMLTIILNSWTKESFAQTEIFVAPNFGFCFLDNNYYLINPIEPSSGITIGKSFEGKVFFDASTALYKFYPVGIVGDSGKIQNGTIRLTTRLLSGGMGLGISEDESKYFSGEILGSKMGVAFSNNLDGHSSAVFLMGFFAQINYLLPFPFNTKSTDAAGYKFRLFLKLNSIATGIAGASIFDGVTNVTLETGIKISVKRQTIPRQF